MKLKLVLHRAHAQGGDTQTRTDVVVTTDATATVEDVARALTARGLVASRIADFKESGGVSGLLKRGSR